MRRTLPLMAYGAATALLSPAVPAILNRRARAGREDPDRVAERLGRATKTRPAGELVWLHGVSVGETQSLLPLVDALLAAKPRLRILVTSGTVAAAKLLAHPLPAGVLQPDGPVDTDPRDLHDGAPSRAWMRCRAMWSKCSSRVVGERPGSSSS